jgi:hypothetical protein
LWYQTEAFRPYREHDGSEKTYQTASPRSTIS